ncbi:hypothetical protein QIA25_04335 [Borreliella spielmanii]|uniref:Uncharacterized protein n=2 Tax=Borreliella spielmanii TaxID=88916 RepID=B9X818_9SPIR|nr:hypothetical protein [Borreliella spielmanii]EEF84599.1 hypothetical protein BSPA14S_0951 [Borreliella spielmanii A14S]MBB6031139.1 hypothetical protein [Borreliella spielmanii]WKC83790.1 hypothetical protein QIA25_04335 [Borreliella spielmanii]
MTVTYRRSKIDRSFVLLEAELLKSTNLYKFIIKTYYSDQSN